MQTTLPRNRHHHLFKNLRPDKRSGNWLKALFSMVLFLSSLNLFAQTSYTVSGPTAGNLARTIADNTTTGGTKILAYNAGAGASDNVWSAAQTIPFTFNFYGTPVTQFVVNKNGLLSFTTSLAGTTTASALNTNAALPNANLPANTIAGFWGNFSAPLGSNDDVWMFTHGTAPNRQLWVLYYSYAMDGLAFTYNGIVLEETSNKVYMVDMYNTHGERLPLVFKKTPLQQYRLQLHQV
jgi:hypothetical protein